MLNACVFYRIARWCYLHHLTILARIFNRLNILLFLCKIPYQMPIGNGLRLSGGGMCLTLNGLSVGDNCTVGTMVVFMRNFPYKDLPRIGNNVYISHGACLVGPIVVEDNVIIAANSVVTKSIPRNAIVAGIPAKIIGWTTDNDYDPRDNPKYKEGTKPYLQTK